MADWLSIMRRAGEFGNMCTSCSRRRIHVVCWAAEVAAIYSASQVDKAVMFCLRDPQHISVPLYVWRISEMDFWSMMSAAKSASAYETRTFLGFSLSVCVPARNVKPVVGVPLRYRIRRLRVFQCLCVGLLAATACQFARK